MTAEIKGISCPPKTWTTLATGKMNVLAAVRGNGDGKIVFGSEQPTAEPGEDYLTLNESRPVSLQFLDASTTVYVWPVSVTLVVEVVRE